MTVRGRFGWKKLSVDRVVFRPSGFDGTGEAQDVFVVERVIVSGAGGKPLDTLLNGPLGVVMHELAGIGVGGIATDMLQTPIEGLHSPVVVGGPAAVLVTADFCVQTSAWKAARQLTVYSRQPKKQTTANASAHTPGPESRRLESALECGSSAAAFLSHSRASHIRRASTDVRNGARSWRCVS